MPKLYINRRAAAEHKADPSLDPDCKNTVFNQIYEGLKPNNHADKPLDFRYLRIQLLSKGLLICASYYHCLVLNYLSFYILFFQDGRLATINGGSASS